jgi:sialidase-1
MRTINLEMNRPTVEEARRRLLAQMRSAPGAGGKVLKVVHGWGSSGEGGKLGPAIRKSLRLRVKEGRVRLVVPGERFSADSLEGRELAQRHPSVRADRDFNRANPGITVVELCVLMAVLVLLLMPKPVQAQAQAQAAGAAVAPGASVGQAETVSSAVAEAGFVRVFGAGVDGYTCFRIPALVSTMQGTLIAVADGRIGNCGDIPTSIDLVCKRSFDGGGTWGPLAVIADYGSDPNDLDSYPFYGLTQVQRVAAGDPALLLDRLNGRVWVFYDNGGVRDGARKIKLELRYSDDDGATWSEAIDLEGRNPGIRPDYGEFLAGPGNGIQLMEGPHAGRLILPVYIYGKPSSSMCLYSDDHGETWRRSESAGIGGGEVQMAETTGGGLIASMRDNGFPTRGVRTFNRSADGGVTWGVPYQSSEEQPALPDPECQGNIYRLRHSPEGVAGRLVHVNAASAARRENLTLRVSDDGGVSWPIRATIYAGPAAYSAVAELANGDLGVLFEKDPYGNLDYVRLPKAAWAGAGAEGGSASSAAQNQSMRGR